VVTAEAGLESLAVLPLGPRAMLHAYFVIFPSVSLLSLPSSVISVPTFTDGALAAGTAVGGAL
jgi:hypothetical protein